MTDYEYNIRYAQFRGRGTASTLIRWQTDSIWSHTGGIPRDNSFVESWVKGGVSHVEEKGIDLLENDLIKCLSKNHKPGTIVDIFGIVATPTQADVFEEFIISQVGEKYDKMAILRFVTRKPYALNNKWFCSELISKGLVKAGIHLQERILCYKMSPQLCGISPLGIPIRSVVTI